MILSSSPPLIVTSSLNQIYANLAIEQILINKARKRRPVFFLWRNRDCVILGRNQNARSEVNLEAAKSAKVDVARRFTGGGTVYQDLGNTVFTFIFPRRKVEKTFGDSVVLTALNKHGIHAESSGRNDLLINGKKFSGSAFQQKANVFVHHGTIIRQTNLNNMTRLLTPHPLKLNKHHATPSVRSRVTELCEYAPALTHDELVESLVDVFKSKLFVKDDERLHVDDYSPLLEAPDYIDLYRLLRSEDWILGTPEKVTESVWFTSQYGVFEVVLTLEDELIESLRVYSDSLDTEMPRRVERVLRGRFLGRKFRAESLASWLRQWDPARGQVLMACPSSNATPSPE